MALSSGMGASNDIKGEGDNKKESDTMGEILLEVDDASQAPEVDEAIKAPRSSEQWKEKDNCEW